MEAISAFLFFALPWLNPFASGPSSGALSLLFSLFCSAGFFFIWYLRTIQRINTFHLKKTVALAWLFAGTFSCLIALCQYFGIAGVFTPWVSQAELGQAFANLRQRNQFASLSGIGLAALIYMAAKNNANSSFGVKAEKYPCRWACSDWSVASYVWFLLLCAGILAVGNAASSSRTGFVQVLVLCGLCWVWGALKQRIVRRILLVALLAYMLAAFGLPWLAGLDGSGYGIFGRLRAGDEVCASRLTLWSNVLHLIAQKPWFGWGWGELDYAHYMSLYDGPRFCDILDNAHNLPLHLAVELGVPFALLVCGGFVWWVWRQQPWRESDADRQLAWTVIALILLHSMLEYPLWYGPFQMAFGFCLLVLWRTRKTTAETGFLSKYALNNRFAHILRAFAATILIVFLLYAAWDYHRISQIYLVPEEREPAYRQDTLVKIRSSRLFSDQVQFAELMLTPLTRENAQWTFDSASALLHFSPEPRVIEKVIESAVFLGRDEEAMVQMVRYRVAFPEAYARWLPTRTLTPGNR